MNRYKSGIQKQSFYGPVENTLIVLTFALMGVFFWAIRGTGGFGGAVGGVLAGLGWAMLWLGFSRFGGASRQRPYGNGFMVAAITFGIGVGGFTGYGVYIAWVQGLFHLDYPNGVREVAPWTGFAMLFFCGLHWGGVAGAFMAWCAPKQPATGLIWAGRIASGVLGAFVALAFVKQFPQLFLPFYSEGIYAVEANATCIRAQDSIQTIAPHIGLFLGFLFFEAARRDWRAVALMLLMAFGFAIPFTVGGIWQTYNSSEIQLPWWKFWEMSIGFGGGLSLGLAFLIFNKPELNAQPQALWNRERILACGVTIILVCAIIVDNTIDGFFTLHEINAPGWARYVAMFAFLVSASGAYIMWVRNHPVSGDSSDDHLLPQWVPLAVLGLIIVAGYAVSVHSNNELLLGMYTFCIFFSGGAFGYMRMRKNG